MGVAIYNQPKVGVVIRKWAWSIKFHTRFARVKSTVFAVPVSPLINLATMTMSTVYTTIDYEYRHQNKGTGLVLILGKCGVYKFDQKSYKMCTASIDMKYTLK